MRAVLVDWLIQVHQQFNLLQETLYLTVAILDRFLQDPIWLEDVFQRFKDQIGTKRVKLTQIMDILDNEW